VQPSAFSVRQHEALADGGDPVHPRDLLRLGDGKGELRAGEEEVVDEVLTRLAELRQVGDHGAVRHQEVARASAATTAERPGAEPAPTEDRRSPSPLAS
jgi:hypothetical protein